MKRYTLLFLLLISLFTSSCSGHQIKECNVEIRETPHAIVATAFSIETEAVLEQMTQQQTCQYDGIVYHFGNAGKQQILLFETGVGPEKAIKTTNTTLANFNIKIIIFSGIAGAIEDSAIGETFVPNTWFNLETGESVALNEEILNLVNPIPSIGVTSPEFVSDEKTVEYIRDTYQASVVDMETFHVAQIAQENNMPFIAFRSVSDHADGNKKVEFYRQAATASATEAINFILLYCYTSP